MACHWLADCWPLVGEWLANGWRLAGQCQANGWPLVGQWLANGSLIRTLNCSNGGEVAGVFDVVVGVVMACVCVGG